MNKACVRIIVITTIRQHKTVHEPRYPFQSLSPLLQEASQENTFYFLADQHPGSYKKRIDAETNQNA